MLKARPLTTDFEREIESAYEETIELLKTLCAIPAPSHHEERRAEFVGEGYYYNDLRRWREAENVNNGPIRKFNNDVILVRSFEPSRDYWWPVPQGEIDLNRNLLPNNPNY